MFCCFLLVCGAFISAADTFITASDLRKLRCFGTCFSTLCCACFHSGDKPPQWRENFACKSGCIGGKARCSYAVRCLGLRTNSTPASLSWIVLVWLITSWFSFTPYFRYCSCPWFFTGVFTLSRVPFTVSWRSYPSR